MKYQLNKWYEWTSEDYVKYFKVVSLEGDRLAVHELFQSAWEKGWTLTEDIYYMVNGDSLNDIEDLEGESPEKIKLANLEAIIKSIFTINR